MPTKQTAKLELTIEPGKQEIRGHRDFDAPRDLVFKAMTEAKAIPHWWGPRKYTTIVDKLEARPGGSWRFINRDDDGNEFAFHGVIHELAGPERIVQTFEFEGWPGRVCLETTAFESLDAGRTRVHLHSVFQSVEDRDGMVASGMEEGANETYERLAEYLKAHA